MSHAPSTATSELGDGSEPDIVPVKMEEEEEEEEDIDMVDDTAPSKPQPKKRKTKSIIPIGRNGLKKRKVTKTKYSTDAKGYTRVSSLLCNTRLGHNATLIYRQRRLYRLGNS